MSETTAEEFLTRCNNDLPGIRGFEVYRQNGSGWTIEVHTHTNDPTGPGGHAERRHSFNDGAELRVAIQGLSSIISQQQRYEFRV